MDNPISAEQLKAELSAANQQFEALRTSLRFQIGDAVISSLSGSTGFRGSIAGLFRLLNRARALQLSARIHAELFSGIPRNGLPLRDDGVSLADLKRLSRAIKAGAAPAEIAKGEIRSSWLMAAFQLTAEFQSAVRDGLWIPGRVTALSRTPRRVLYVTQHDPLSATNGYAKRTAEIVRRLEARGYSVACVVPPKTGGAVGDRAVEDGTINYLLTGSHVLRENGLVAYIEALSLVVEREARKHDADVIHAASNYLNGFAALHAARRLGLPCVYEVRGLWEETRSAIDPRFPQTLGYRLQARLEANCAEQADSLIVGAAEIASELERRGVTRSAVIAPSGAPTIKIADQVMKERIRKKYGFAGRRLIGFVGSITAYEGLEVLLSALKTNSLQDVCCLIIGDGQHADIIRRRVAKMKLSDRVVQTGRLGFDEAIAGLSTVDLCVYARTRSRVTELVEPLKPLEALAAGIPIIVSDVAPLKRLSDACVASICVEAGNSVALSSAIRNFFAMPEDDRVSLGDAGKSWVMANRHWETTIDAIEASYRSLIAPPASPV